MTRSSRSTLPKRPTVLTPVELQAGIDRLQKRLEDVKQFVPQSVTEQHNIPHVEKISAAIDDALVRTFGSDSSDYERYRGAKDFDNGPFNYVYHVPISQVHQSLARSRASSIALLEQAIESLQERLMETDQSTPMQTNAATLEQRTSVNELTLIADSRLNELRTLTSTQFDFKKLIRLCEEINIVYSEKCYFATAMLTRGLLDHVPPLFEKKTFSEVANNYGGSGTSFKDAMHHLENATRKVADAHLHMPIRKSETLPVAQQVNSATQLDMLLSEILRIMQNP